MNLIEQLLGHGRWFTDKCLEAALALSDGYLDREFDTGHRTYRKTAVHLVNVIEAETAWLRRVPPVDDVLRRMAWRVLDHAWEMEEKDRLGKAAASACQCV